ncbi:T9SS type A sorting domain-containing protein [Cryomorpha ignava]|uniref:T9SS type A sorting domain-containing protein n=1 Tax=Cryomorpha ignava TaxID=101383 RepID=A0A7K3WNV7_9FLAO|nr:T9SS type A sorting domain-containing protein [Cryomorpha ignava]NEN23343.1 T9SS type A sorting domain-containing protein [Cryomorpha ignava]
MEYPSFFGPDSIFQPDSIIAPYDSYVEVNPQLSGTIGEFITNYDGWHEIAWDYTANGDETFMYIGNFQPDSETDTLYVLQEDPSSNYSLFSYYYIDKIELREGTLSTIDIPLEQLFKIYPNPGTNGLKIESSSNIDNIQIFNLEGRNIQNVNFVSNEIYDVDISPLSSGMYIIKIVFENGLVENSKFIKR